MFKLELFPYVINLHSLDGLKFWFLSFKFSTQFSSDSSTINHTQLVLLHLLFQIFIQGFNLFVKSFNVLLKFLTNILKLSFLSFFFLSFPFKMSFFVFPLSFPNPLFIEHFLSFFSFSLFFFLSFPSLVPPVIFQFSDVVCMNSTNVAYLFM